MRVYPSLSSPFPSLFRSLSLFLFLVRLVYKSNYVSASKSKTRFQGEGKTLRVSDWGAVSCLMYFWLNLWRENWICPALSVVLLVNKLTGLPSIARGRPGPKASHERERAREKVVRTAVALSSLMCFMLIVNVYICIITLDKPTLFYYGSKIAHMVLHGPLALSTVTGHE